MNFRTVFLGLSETESNFLYFLISCPAYRNLPAPHPVTNHRSCCVSALLCVLMFAKKTQTFIAFMSQMLLMLTEVFTEGWSQVFPILLLPHLPPPILWRAVKQLWRCKLLHQIKKFFMPLEEIFPFIFWLWRQRFIDLTRTFKTTRASVPCVGLSPPTAS